MGLPVNPDVPLLGFIGRLDYQKDPLGLHWALGLPEVPVPSSLQVFTSSRQSTHTQDSPALHVHGIDLIRDNYDWLMSEGCQLIMLGSGREDLENDLRDMENRCGVCARVCVWRTGVCACLCVCVRACLLRQAARVSDLMGMDQAQQLANTHIWCHFNSLTLHSVLSQARVSSEHERAWCTDIPKS
eukprot:1142103-Pelagomonas_calceolata.AAC.6